jgi:uncharacterized protein YdaU (DUF1376 family)
MAKPKLILFPIPIHAWDKLTSDLDAKQERALYRLVAFYAEHGGVPINDEAMAAIARVDIRTWRKSMRATLALKFPVEGWRWPEIDQRIAHFEKVSVQKSLAAQQANLKRWGTLRATSYDMPKRKLVPR